MADDAHPPTVDEDGNVLIWDPELGKYVPVEVETAVHRRALKPPDER